MTRTGRFFARLMAASPLLLAALALLLPEISFAAAAPSGDLSLGTLSASDKLISTLVAPVFGDAANGSPGGPLSDMIGIFNGAILLVGGILSAYTMLAGTMMTAHDGEMLGKKFSSLWIPIRTALGTAMVIPLGNGFCAAQTLVFWLAFQGLALGNSALTAFMGQMTMSGFAPTAVAPDVADLARGVLTAEVCMAAYNKLANSSPDASLMLPLAQKTTDGNGGVRLGGGGGAPADSCGSVKFNNDSALWMQTKALAGAVVGSGYIDNKAQIAAAQAAQKAAFSQLEGTLAGLANQIVNSADGGGATPSASTLTTAIMTYETSVAKAMQTPEDSAQYAAFKQSVISGGLRDAGMFPMKAAYLQDRVTQSIAATTPSATVGWTGSTFSGTDASKYRKALDAFDRQPSSSWKSLTKDGGITPEIDGVRALISAIFGKSVQKIMEFTFVGKNPLIAAKNFGDALMLTGEGMIVAGSAFYISSSGTAGVANGWAAQLATLGASAGAAGALASTGVVALMLLTPAGLALLGFGSMLSVYLPMAPYIVWVGCILGYFILLVEAVFAAPLWAVMHLNPDGHDWSGGAGPGYSLLLSLVLRPALMVMGLAASFVVLQPLGDWINATFFEAFFSAMGASMTGLVTAIVMAGMYVGLMVWLIHKVFALCHVIPDQLLRWIGSSSGSNLGEYGGSAMEHGKGQSVAAGAALGSSIGSIGQTAQNAKRMGIDQQSAARESAHAINDLQTGTDGLMSKSEGDMDKMSSASLSQGAAELRQADSKLSRLQSAGVPGAGEARQGMAAQASKMEAKAGQAAAREAGQSHFENKASGSQTATRDNAVSAGKEGYAAEARGDAAGAASSYSSASAGYAAHASDLSSMAQNAGSESARAGLMQASAGAMEKSQDFGARAAALSKGSGGEGGAGTTPGGGGDAGIGK
jgi:conjugal transfer/type IV secretion protein DotA/TraY